MTISKRIKQLTGLLLAILLLSACASSRMQQPVYYVLQSQQSEAVAKSAEAKPLLVWPIQMPAVLKQSGIAVIEGQRQLQVSELHRWADPLPDGIASYITEGVNRQLPDWFASTKPGLLGKPHYSLKVSFTELVGPLEGPVRIRGNASVHYQGELLQSLVFQAQTEVVGSGYEAYVIAVNRLLDRMLIDIYQALPES